MHQKIIKNPSPFYKKSEYKIIKKLTAELAAYAI